LTPRTSDPKTFEYLKNCISSDLLRRLEESSPIKSNTPGFHRKISEIFLLNCDKDAFVLSELNYKEDKLKNGSKNDWPEINFDEKELDLKNLKQNTKNYLPKNTPIIKDTSFNSSKFSGNDRDEENERPALPINFNIEKSESPRHKPAKYTDSNSSPIFNYYNDTSEYYSQIFTGNYNNSNKLVGKNNNEFLKLHLLRKDQSNQGSSNNLSEQVNGNNFDQRERLNVSNFSPNINENAQVSEGNNDYKNFPILSRFPQRANLIEKKVYSNSDTNGLVNGKSPNSSINEINDDSNNNFKISGYDYLQNSNYESNFNNSIAANNPGNFTKLNFNQPSENFMDQKCYNNNLNADPFNPQVYFQNNNYHMMNHNGNNPFHNTSNENAFFSKMKMQSFNFPMDNQPMNPFFIANNPNQDFIENGEDNRFMKNYNRQKFNNPNFNMNKNEEQINNQFWQKNLGKKNNSNNYASGQNRNSNEDFNGSMNQNSIYTSKFDPEEYIVEMFGKRGWICEACNNFNYESMLDLFLIFLINKIFYF
jgi:hypothetical protein